MIFLNVNSAAWAYSVVTLGTDLLNSAFSFFYVKLFLHLYKISEETFCQAQAILMIWNILNDLIGYFCDSFKADCGTSRYLSALLGGPLCAMAFLLPWFPWKNYQEGDWLNGIHLMVSSCAFESTLSCIQQAQCRWFVGTFPRHESRLRLLKINHVASLIGSASVLFFGLISNNMESLPEFQAAAVLIAFLAAASMRAGMNHMKCFEWKRSLEENVPLGTEEDLALWMGQILTQKNLYLFLITSFFQVFHLAVFSNFMMIFTDHLIPGDILSSSVRSVMYGASFICPQCLLLVGHSWLKKFGYYKIILVSFYLEGTASIVMLLLGADYYYCLALYLTLIMVIVKASYCLFNLPLADMIDAELLKFNRQPLFPSMVFGINALLTKPARFLAPMVILSKLTQFGYRSPDRRNVLGGCYYMPGTKVLEMKGE
ncbi:transmembrane protein 180 isoform X2 [Ochotona princeps]|uniref:transmembrane protein 180 isoform X2 n=1 Tax=Ochotona princeps TaxID=9978 RepID=UPI002715236E|nr:transmembrane protein 180 isoform X2 [Ochotona princeps]